MAKVLITGTNRGIGLEFVRQYLARGDDVLATCRDVAGAVELPGLASSESRLCLYPLDVNSKQSMMDFADEIKNEAIDILISNAGIYGPRDASFGNVSAADWNTVLHVNSVAPMLLTQHIIGSLKQGSEKKLVYITSRMGSIDDNKGGGSYIYRSSKTALNSVVRSLSVDLASDGFSVAAVHPGWVLTDMGGPNALINTETSVGGMVGVIDNLSQQNTGQFFNYDGAAIPW